MYVCIRKEVDDDRAVITVSDDRGVGSVTFHLDPDQCEGLAKLLSVGDLHDSMRLVHLEATIGEVGVGEEPETDYREPEID